MTRIKICGLSRPQDVAYVNQAKPDWCGFVVNFPKSRRSVTPDQLRALRRELDPSVVPVGVFVDQPVEVVTDLLNRGIISIAQLHGGEDEDYTAALRAAPRKRRSGRPFRSTNPPIWSGPSPSRRTGFYWTAARAPGEPSTGPC